VSYSLGLLLLATVVMPLLGSPGGKRLFIPLALLPTPVMYVYAKFGAHRG
jgi:hypothetical protein